MKYTELLPGMFIEFTDRDGDYEQRVVCQVVNVFDALIFVDQAPYDISDARVEDIDFQEVDELEYTTCRMMEKLLSGEG